MSAAHFFVDSLVAGPMRLSPADSRHALRSLRLRPGEDVTLADGRGAVAEGRVAGADEGIAIIDVGHVRHVARARPTVWVGMAPPAGDRLSWGVQKLGEIGCDKVVVVHTERTVRSWSEGRAERVADRLRMVAREAAMQSRQPFILDVAGGVSFPEALSGRSGVTVVLAQGSTARLADVLPEDASSIGLLVGPEGGWTEAEIELAVGSGASLATVGAPILRTETAAIIGAALVLARYGRLG